ncbi:EmrB/QacA subfamily drug resistance transporter [Kribbella orskensis]|uniref:EmrB/QacA subfamily drug resistance transporter n=1 Tax=Kribbella orskensis TaxID=2512216 RepID=A0ABY2BVG6_9ACTN|nr:MULTISPECIES: MFS transporter [Kribbella]TCN44834.1 EmrB/QacA subfamily drug resistance transporter [Kribbella sp. VKM Ac-2500]TCO31388.1 EmrB/QacA subfamily drug resistance transporter [Kribbella orskensis]
MDVTLSARQDGPTSPRAVALSGGLHPVGVFFLLAGAFLPIMDFFITNVALPSIDASLHASASELELVIAGYGVAYAALLVLGGRVGDRLGRHRVFLAALVGFVVASAVCGFAPTVGVLIAARVVQGATAALLVPQVLATFHHTLEHERKARALALYGATSGIAAVVGQLAGGLLVGADIAGTSWRPIFLVNVPIGVVVLLVAARIVPDTRSDRPVGIDLPGTVLFAATLIALLVPLTEGHSLGWPWWTWAMIVLAVVLGAATFMAERRAEQRGEIPLLPPSLLRLPSMSRGLVMVFAFSIGFGAFMFVFALTVQDGLHADALHGGLAILPMAVLFFLGSVFAPRVIGRFGRAALSGGAVIQLAGLASLVVVVVNGWPHVSLWAMAVPLALAGAGQSMLFAGLFRSVLADVPTHLGGVGSGVLITLQQSGLALGVATLGTLYLTRAEHNTAHAFATVEAVQMGIIALLAIGVAALPRFTAAAADAPLLDA